MVAGLRCGRGATSSPCPEASTRPGQRIARRALALLLGSFAGRTALVPRFADISNRWATRFASSTGERHGTLGPQPADGTTSAASVQLRSTTPAPRQSQPPRAHSEFARQPTLPQFAFLSDFQPNPSLRT